MRAPAGSAGLEASSRGWWASPGGSAARSASPAEGAASGGEGCMPSAGCPVTRSASMRAAAMFHDSFVARLTVCGGRLDRDQRHGVNRLRSCRGDCASNECIQSPRGGATEPLAWGKTKHRLARSAARPTRGWARGLRDRPDQGGLSTACRPPSPRLHPRSSG